MRGVIYVRTYEIGEIVSEELGCAFYQAKADDKSEVLQQWIDGSSGWIVATGALGTGINIEGIVEVIHIDRPYGLTSFAQQSGRGGRSGEVSNSTIIVRVDGGYSNWAQRLQSDYTVEKIDEDAMSKYIESKGCRRTVLAEYFDLTSQVGEINVGSSSCRESVCLVVYCDYCERMSQQERIIEQLGQAEEMITESGVDLVIEQSGRDVIADTLLEEGQQDQEMFKVMTLLKQNCIFCILEYGKKSQGGFEDRPHMLSNCTQAELNKCGIEGYEKWRKGIDLKGMKNCYKCGLGQEMCRFVENGSECEFAEVMFLGLYVLYQQGYLQEILEGVGFLGVYTKQKEIWEWMKKSEQGEKLEWESNLVRVWRQVCLVFRVMQK
jgi:hypothetical protein